MNSYNSNSDDWGEGSEKIFALANISGDADSLSMPEAGVRMKRTWGDHSQDVTGAVEWQGTTYQDTESSDIYTAVSANDLSAEYYASAPETPSVDLSGIDCSTEGNIIVEWGMDSASFQATDEACGGGGDDDDEGSPSNMCWGDEVQNAHNASYGNN